MKITTTLSLQQGHKTVNWHLAGERWTLPVRLKIAVLIPIKLPFESSRGPPLSKIHEKDISLMLTSNIYGDKDKISLMVFILG